ncbi:hypothetical protein [Sphaerisporangium sp. NPDC051011]
MCYGIDAVSVPAGRRPEFNTAMVHFFLIKNGIDMFAFPTPAIAT